MLNRPWRRALSRIYHAEPHRLANHTLEQMITRGYVRREPSGLLLLTEAGYQAAIDFIEGVASIRLPHLGIIDNTPGNKARKCPTCGRYYRKNLTAK